MTGGLLKNTFRSIRDSFGRYISILLIVLLGVGFYAGLSVTERVLTSSVDAYQDKHNLYDIYLLSSYGFSKDDIEKISKTHDVNHAEGVFFSDILMTFDEVQPFRLMSMTDDINKPYITAGKMPEEDHEVLADDAAFSEDDIGKTIAVSGDSPEEVKDALKIKEFKITGLAKSPLFLSEKRGSTELGNGELAGFLLCRPEAYDSDRYYGCYVDLDTEGAIYSKAYEKSVRKLKKPAAEAAEQSAEAYYDKLKQEAEEKVADAFLEKLDETASAAVALLGIIPDRDNIADLMPGFDEAAEAAKKGIPLPEITVLDRNINAGYKRFESDVKIVSAIEKVFPVFFFLVAALVSASTMSRMMEEERMHLGIFLSMGYSRSAILGKYFIYSGSAGLIGWFLGIASGRRVIPMAVWKGYGSIYEFPEEMVFPIDYALFALCLVVALLVTAGVTIYFGRKELKNTPAMLIRPKAPTAGKKILLEKVSFWKKLDFLHKVSFRNLFRYKVRSFMMITGIAGCTALMVAGFGIRGSFSSQTDLEYGKMESLNMMLNVHLIIP